MTWWTRMSTRAWCRSAGRREVRLIGRWGRAGDCIAPGAGLVSAAERAWAASKPAARIMGIHIYRRRPPARPPWARRASAGGFVIDEEGLGYADIGEEIDWGRGEGAENAAANEPASKGAKAAGGKAGGQKGERAPWLGGERGQAAAACSRGSLRRAGCRLS